MKNNFWAKSNGVSLGQHIADVLQGIEVLRQRRQEDVPAEWWLALQYAALLHDLGKIDPDFQGMLQKGGAAGPGPGIPHSLFSLFFFRPERLGFENLSAAHVVVSAVAFHHWRESFPDIILGYHSGDVTAKAKEFIAEPDKWENLCQRAAEELGEMAERYGLNREVIDVNETLIDYLQHNTLGAAGILVPPYTLAFLPTSMRVGDGNTERERFRIFVAGNLMRADHFASLVEDGTGRLQISDIEQGAVLPADMVDARITAQLNTSSYWQREFFAARPELQGASMILVAPTGFGKTEFAYLWGAGRKNLMLLPMRAATNKIFERTEKLFGEEQVALLHGDASLELYIRSRQKNVFETEGERRKAMDLARHLTKPYIVATADQVAPSALRYPGYERIHSILMDSVLVIDEVQAYDPRAAAIITHLIQQNSFLGGKTLLMTATLPPFIRKEIVRRAGLDDKRIVNLIELPDFAEIATSARHRVSFLLHDGSFAPVIEEIIKAAVAGKKVLVIMNTVQAACEIYSHIKVQLQEKNIQINHTLLHSRFTTERRKELERLVMDKLMPNKAERDLAPCIVVTTQIVEASLDIDADILFTEPAPADSLVQRMGRVYRRYARSRGLHAPEGANVIIMVEDKAAKKGRDKGKKEQDARLGSGIGSVYERNLTALSLVVLAREMRKELLGEDEPLQLAGQIWEPCFHKRKGKKRKDINSALCKILLELSGKSIVLNEGCKMDWVEETYSLLERQRDPDFPLALGNYIDSYVNALEILDHGYCSDKRRDAQKNFRPIYDITGIPAAIIDDFYAAVVNWVNDVYPSLDYVDLATTILPKYLVSCPYHSADKGGTKYYQELDLDRILSHINVHDQSLVYKKLERWLSDIVVLDMPYDPEKGLSYYDL